jgi:hypothetical protein
MMKKKNSPKMKKNLPKMKKTKTNKKTNKKKKTTTSTARKDAMSVPEDLELDWIGLRRLSLQSY